MQWIDFCCRFFRQVECQAAQAAVAKHAALLDDAFDVLPCRKSPTGEPYLADWDASGLRGGIEAETLGAGRRPGCITLQAMGVPENGAGAAVQQIDKGFLAGGLPSAPRQYQAVVRDVPPAKRQSPRRSSDSQS